MGLQDICKLVTKATFHPKSFALRVEGGGGGGGGGKSKKKRLALPGLGLLKP